MQQEHVPYPSACSCAGAVSVACLCLAAGVPLMPWCQRACDQDLEAYFRPQERLPGRSPAQPSPGAHPGASRAHATGDEALAKRAGYRIASRFLESNAHPLRRLDATVKFASSSIGSSDDYAVGVDVGEVSRRIVDPQHLPTIAQICPEHPVS